MSVKRFKRAREKVALQGAPAAREFGACVMDRRLGENDLSGGGKGKLHILARQLCFVHTDTWVSFFRTPVFGRVSVLRCRKCRDGGVGAGLAMTRSWDGGGVCDVCWRLSETMCAGLMLGSSVGWMLSRAQCIYSLRREMLRRENADGRRVCGDFSLWSW